ncbi:MAG: DUF4189 domain-containing protein [Achromobacter sp.]|nr:DUF4189 domain-containing protein [Achromobacter sp.]
MKRFLVLAFAVFALALAAMRPAAAEQGCPDGYTMAALGTAQCIPIPGLYQVPGGAQPPQQPAPPPVRWEERWGAIAFDPVSGKTGVAGSRPGRRQAEDDAVAICRQKGGGACKLEISYANQCGVIVWGNNWAVAKFAATLEQATEQALNQCNRDSGGTCEVFFSDCSMPVRVQ